MKKIIISILSMSIIIMSCKSSSNETPKDVMKRLSANGKQGDLDAAFKEMCAADVAYTKQLIKDLAKQNNAEVNVFEKEVNEGFKKAYSGSDIAYENEKINGNQATIDAVNKTKGKTTTLPFIKEGGQWKICVGVEEKFKTMP